jgi:hypothetical protein
MSYFDDDKGRLGFAPLDRCYRSRVCALMGGHGGGCDPRCERARVRAVMRLPLGHGTAYDDAGLLAAVEHQAAEALRMAEALLAMSEACL